MGWTPLLRALKRVGSGLVDCSMCEVGFRSALLLFHGGIRLPGGVGGQCVWAYHVGIVRISLRGGVVRKRQAARAWWRAGRR